jgi:hypothetical protein
LPEDLYRPRDLAGVQGVERMAGPGRTVPVNAAGTVATGVLRVVGRYH